ncbi:hypothetical protein K488DRAFT_77014 [Vararia minispora EC-137]|uniref:Uncharacterized protein n=1 Tax=Vararia minispora EC-137 TaxID=1314806 RepID=A0ACB8QT95_9AGAM|nr:hypothetical protein K488DRAFT_77014 [Vararia minispora EC-137]
MPKATKKKKEKVADFSKAKLKLGKGKQLPSNQVDTSFKARSIAIPSQSIAQTKNASVPTTKRRLTLDDLLAHLKHYSAGTRRDAVFGLRELLEVHPELIEQNLTRIFAGCVKIIGDEDANVRKALLGLFSWLLPLLPPNQLAPHTPLLLLFTTSAQTHIFPEIQLDAVRLLDILLDVAPRAFAVRQVLQGYLSLLNAGTKFGEEPGDGGPVRATSTASVVLSAGSKLVVLRSLAKFFGVMLKEGVLADPSSTILSSSTIPTWYLAPSFVSPEAYAAFDALFRPRKARTQVWKDEINYDAREDVFVAELAADLKGEASWTLQDLADLGADAGPSQKILRTLHPVLLSTYLDAAPNAFAPGAVPSEIELSIVSAIADIYRTLYSALLRRPANTSVNLGTVLDDLHVLLGHMAPHFPFRTAAIKQDGLALAFCALVSLLALRRPKARMHAQRVAEYVVKTLEGPGGRDALARPVTPTIYVALLPTVWALLNGEDNGDAIVKAVLEHALKVPATSATSPLTIGFVARLVLLETERGYEGKWTLSRNADAALVERWVLSLPKTLWELGNANSHTSEAILRLLLRLVQRKSPLAGDKVCPPSDTSERLTPFFAMRHPTRGEILGPFSKLHDPYLRRLALDTAAMLVWSGRADQSLEAAAHSATTGRPEEAYWASVCHSL